MTRSFKNRTSRNAFRRIPDKHRQILARILGVLGLLPPLIVTIGYIKISQARHTTTLIGLSAAIVTLHRICDWVKAVFDVAWRLCSAIEPRERDSASPRLRKSELPLIDIIITACHEDAEMIMDTVQAACQIDYPRTKFRVIVADDGNDPDLQFKVTRLSRLVEECSNLFYFARDKKDLIETNPKVCNVKKALEWIERSCRPMGKSKWFAVLDCDMIPEPQFLRSLLGEASKDGSIAMAVCPQNYYNIPVNDPLYQVMSVQNDLDEPARNSFWGTWCAGSGFLARRAAIDSIGGMPTSSVCEDILCSYLLNGQGWRVVYVNDALQWGLMPDSIESHIAQRRRWAVGSVQNGKITKFCLGTKARQMTVAQRLAGIAYCLAPYDQYLFQPLSHLVLPWSFVSEGAATISDGTLRVFLFWNLIGQVLSMLKTCVESTWTTPHTLLQREYSLYWLRSTIASSVVAEMLPEKLGPYQRHLSPFVSSGSIQSSLSERTPCLRAPLRQRLRTILSDQKYLVNTIMATNALLSLCFLLKMDVARIWSGQPAILTLISHSLAPIMAWECQMSFFIPILYAIMPPDVPARREMMELDEKGAWRVKEKYKRPQLDKWAFLGELQAYIGLVWSAIALLLVSTRWF